MLEFRASAVAATELRDLNSFVVVLAENDDGSGARLEIQRAISFDERDVELGQDTYCLATEGGATCYGGVAACNIEPGHLEIVLQREAAEALGVDRGFAVSFPPEQVALLVEGLRRMFGDSLNVGAVVGGPDGNG